MARADAPEPSVRPVCSAPSRLAELGSTTRLSRRVGGRSLLLDRAFETGLPCITRSALFFKHPSLALPAPSLKRQFLTPSELAKDPTYCRSRMRCRTGRSFGKLRMTDQPGSVVAWPARRRGRAAGLHWLPGPSKITPGSYALDRRHEGRMTSRAGPCSWAIMGPRRPRPLTGHRTAHAQPS